MDGTERAGGASLIPSTRRGGGPPSPPPPLVARIARQHQARAQRFHRLRRARQAPAVSADPPAPLRRLWVPAPDFRALGAATTAPAPTEATDGPSSRRAPPGGGRGYCGSFALARPGVNCPSALGRGRRCPAGTNAGVKRACGHVSCRSCCCLRLRSCLRLEPFKWDCSTNAAFVKYCNIKEQPVEPACATFA